MRISADIIDEEPADPLDLVSRNLTTEILVEKDAKESDLNWFFKKFATEQDDVPPRFTTKSQMKQHFQKMHEEVTRKFKDLHLSDTASSSAQASSGSASSTSNNMEQNLNDLPKDLETAPVWLQQYLLKMKQDIKKEVLDELLSSESSGEAHPLKIASSNKLHDLQDSIVHMGIYCDNCDQIIQGIRYKCVNCSDFDLCQECESLPYIHNAYHMFLKVRHPLPLRLKPVDEPTSGVRVYTKSKKAQTKKLYEARFIRDDTIPDSTVLAPSTQFVKSWRIMNSGTRVWNHNTKLQLIQGSADLTPTSDQVDVPHLRPGEVGVVSVVFKTPPLPGLYRSHWNFCHKSRPFGDIVWCHIIVHAEGGAEKGATVPKIVVPPKRKTDSSSSQSEASCIEQVLSAVKKEHERGNMVPRKLVASSHTATPNNTPFDLSPPKSPDHHVTSVKELQNLTPNSKVSDNEDDVVSLGSSESDTEFVVIPMPKCFNMSESFLSQNIPPWAQEQDTDDSSPEPALTRSNPELQPTSQPRVPIRRSATTSETVSQETGVPELSQDDYERTTIRFVEEQNEGVKINYVSVVSDGSSSEISIIESEENSPVEENIEDKSVVNISVTSAPQDGATGPGGVVNEVEEVQVNEEVVDIPSNTFPKFPIEGITGTFDPSPVSSEERTVQVLPEGLVTGALSAAASVYNTAKAAINAMHTPRVEPGFIIPQSPPTLDPTQNPMDQLAEMGFCNREQNEELLRKHNNDVALVVAELVSLNDNDWYESRHIPSARPPAFD